MTTATGLTCVDYLSPKFNIHTFQDTEYNLSKHALYEYNFQQLSTYFHERNSFTNRPTTRVNNNRNSNTKGLMSSLTQQQSSCLQELRCNFTKLNLAEKFMQSCERRLATSPPQLLEHEVCTGRGSTATTAAVIPGKTVIPSKTVIPGESDIISPVDPRYDDDNNEDDLYTDSFSFGNTPASSSPLHRGSPVYTHQCSEKLHDSDTCDTDDDEIAGYIFNNKKPEQSSTRDFRTFSTPDSPKDFRTINASPISDVTDEDYSDSEIELAMINSGVYHTNPLTKQSRKRSSDCLQEYGIKRPCIDVEKMHSSLTNCLTPLPVVASHSKQLFVPIDVQMN